MTARGSSRHRLHALRAASALAAFAAAMACAGTGCSSGAFYATNLPPKFHAPPFRGRSTADLSRFAVASSSPNVIAAGDVLEVTIVSGAEPTRPAPWTLRVDAAGGLDLPFVGSVRVEGLELTAAEKLVREESIRRDIYRDPHVAIVVKDHLKVRVTVVGEVVKPGTYELPASQASLVTAIAAAGGMNEKADTKIALRNPTYSTDLRYASADEPADEKSAVAVAVAEADVEPESDEKPATEALATDDAASAEKKSADAKSADEKPAEKEKSPEEAPKVATKDDSDAKAATKPDAAKPDEKKPKASDKIRLVSAEADLEATPAQTASYDAESTGEVMIDLLSAESGAARYPIEDGAVLVVKEKPPRTIQVIGLVKRPDRFEYPDDQEIRLLDAIALAGGRTMEIADSVKIIRQIPGEPKPVVILASVHYAKQGSEDNLALMPGDVVSLEETPLTFTVDTVRNLLRFGITTF